MVHLITGYKGSEHIQSKDARSFNVAMFGGGEFVMEIGNEIEASITNNNTVRVLDGDILMQGGHIRIETDTYEDLAIRTGTAGKNRIDLIVMTYEKNSNDGTEDAYLEVLKGQEAEGVPNDPEYVSGDIAAGALKNQMPLYRIKIEGVVLTSLEPLFKTIPTYKTLAEIYEEEFQTACQTHLDSLNILDTMEEIEANTQPNQLAGALAVKELAKGGTIRYNTETDMVQICDAEGVWHDWQKGGLAKLFLYDLGEIGQKTGGFGTGVGGASGSFVGGKVTFNESYIEELVSADWNVWGYAGIYTKNKVDVTNYSKLKMTYIFAKGQGAVSYLGLSSNQVVTAAGQVEIKGTEIPSASSMTTMEVDISQVSGSYYIKSFMSNNQGYASSLKMYKIWLE